MLDVLPLRGVFEPFDRGKRKEIVGNHYLNKTLNNVFHLFDWILILKRMMKYMLILMMGIRMLWDLVMEFNDF